MAESGIQKQVNAIRAFNRFYTRKIGVLDGMASSPFSLVGARVLYEMAIVGSPPPPTSARSLGSMPVISAYAAPFRTPEVRHARAVQDGRTTEILVATSKGRSVFAPRRALEPGCGRHARRPVAHRAEATGGLGAGGPQTPGRPSGGENLPFAAAASARRYGLIVHRQAILYADEYGWDGTYEALAAEIVAQFIKNYDPKRERAWVAEKDGERVGAAFVARGSDEIVKLWLLHVERQSADWVLANGWWRNVSDSRGKRATRR